jgi:hypothetical protein
MVRATMSLDDLAKDPMSSETMRNFGFDLMSEIFSKSQDNIVANGTSNTGFLLRSGIPPFFEGNMITFKYTAPHTTAIEFGLEAGHFIPKDVVNNELTSWVIKKLGKRKKEANSIAWAIAVKIRKEGTDPQPFIIPAVNMITAKRGISRKGVGQSFTVSMGGNVRNVLV